MRILRKQATMDIIYQLFGMKSYSVTPVCRQFLASLTQYHIYYVQSVIFPSLGSNSSLFNLHNRGRTRQKGLQSNSGPVLICFRFAGIAEKRYSETVIREKSSSSSSYSGELLTARTAVKSGAQINKNTLFLV